MPTFNIKEHGFKEMWSYYLYSNYKAPTDDSLLEESIIRDNKLRYDKVNKTYDQTIAKPDPISISATGLYGER